MIKALMQGALVCDKLYEQTGVEEEDLLYSIEISSMDRDPEFLRLMQEFLRKQKTKAKQVKSGVEQI
jgi:hypothetical protein